MLKAFCTARIKTLGFALLSLAVAFTVGAPARAEDDYQAGVHCMEGNQCEQAIEHFNKVIASDPNNPDAHLLRGQAYHDLHKQQPAIDDFNKVISLRPNDARALGGRASAYCILGEYKKSIDDVTSIIRMDPKIAWIYQLRAQSLHGMGRNEEALKDITRSINLGNKSSFVYFLRGTCHLENHEYKKTLVDCDRALSYDPSNTEALFLKGNVYERLGNTSMAIAQYDKAIATKKKSAAYSLRAWTEYRAGNFAKALEDYNLHLSTFPKDDNAYLRRGDAYLALHHTSEAMQDYRRCLEFNPNARPQILSRLTTVLVRLRKPLESTGDYQTLVKFYSDALDVCPGEASFHMGRAHSYYRLAEYKASIADCDVVIKSLPNYLEAYETRGNLHCKLGEYQDAVDDFSYVIRRNPDLKGAFKSRGAAYLALGQYKNAIDDFTNVLDRFPDDLDSYRKRAQAYEKLGERDLAQADIHAIESRSKNPDQ